MLDATGGAHLRHTDVNADRQRQHVISRVLTRLGEKKGLGDDVVQTHIAGCLKYGCSSRGPRRCGGGSSRRGPSS